MSDTQGLANVKIIYAYLVGVFIVKLSEVNGFL